MLQWVCSGGFARDQMITYFLLFFTYVLLFLPCTYCETEYEIVFVFFVAKHSRVLGHIQGTDMMKKKSLW